MKQLILKTLKLAFRSLLVLLYRVDIKGLEHYHAAGKRVLIVANHTSFLDAALLTLFLPGKPTFAINTEISQRLIFRPFLAFATLFPMDPTNPLSTKSLINYLKGDRRAVIFPEGRITVTGSLMKIYDGTGMVAERADATVLPIRIEGAQLTPFSRLRGVIKLRWFPKVTMTILPARRITPPEGLSARERRKFAGEELARIMTNMMFETSRHDRTLFTALLEARRNFGRKHQVLEDINRKPLNYDRLITGAFALGHALSKQSNHAERIGVLLPNMSGTVVAFMGLQAYGRVPAMLNYTAGFNTLRAACETAVIKTVITSRKFIEAAQLEEVAEGLTADGIKLIYLEQLVASLTLFDKLRGWLACRFASLVYNRTSGGIEADDPATIIFTSGSEGTPKGVVLSHNNLLANREQIAARIAFSSQDTVLNVLPIFHSFGLTAGTLLPLLSGMKCFLYPSPLHYRVVPEIAYEIGATVLFGTNTFLAKYAHHAHPYDFYTMRYVVAGAEKLQQETRKVWMEKFGLRILEGYGATETSPVLAVNTPMAHRAGSVGQMMPGIDHALEPVEGVAEGGRLHVRGPNVMLGYLLHNNPGVLVPPASSQGSGWYDTGDIVTVDDEGFVHIQGRAKRFAKIGGEMVSLATAEGLASHAWPDALHAVVTLPDPQKGEVLVLITEVEEAERSALVAAAKAQGVSELNVPKKILTGMSVPLLGTGKVDYTTAQQLAESAQ